MTAQQRAWPAGLAGLVVVTALAVAAHWARRQAQPGCDLDGGRIVPDYRVEIIDAGGRRHTFCCLRCAAIWLKHEPAGSRSITVVDEASGQSLDAGSAWYVRSSVVTTPATGNRVHVFLSRADAERHADKFRGTVLLASENPFRPQGGTLP